MDLKSDSNINCRNILSIYPPQRSNYDISYVSVNTSGPYRHSVRALLLCNSQTCVDHRTTVTNNEDKCKSIEACTTVSTRRIILSDCCSAQVKDLNTDMKTQRKLLSDSIDNYKYNRRSCNVFMPNIKKDSSDTSKEEYSNDECTSNYDVSCSTECLEYRSHGTQDIFSKEESKTYENNVEHESKVIFEDDVIRANKDICTTSCLQENDPKFEEKSIINMYKQELIYKNNEKNNRLQNVVRKLVEVREKEKQKEAWNNYINELKDKHCYRSKTSNVNIARPANVEIIDDYVNTTFMTNKSGPCRHLLQDIYAPQHTVQQPRYLYPTSALLPQLNNKSISRNENQYVYGNDLFCCPISSQGRLIMLQRKKRRDKFCNTPCPLEKSHVNNIKVPKHQTSKQLNNSRNKKPKLKKNRSSSVQTEEAPSLILYQENAENEAQRESDEIDEDEENERNSRLETELKKDEMIKRLEREREEFLREAEESLRREAEELKREKEKRLNMEEKQLIEILKADETDDNQVYQKVDRGIQKGEDNEAGQNVSYSKKEETVKEQYERVSDNVARLKEKIDVSKNGSRENSFVKIESKLDTLIDTINSLIVEIKTKKCTRDVPKMNKCTLTTCISKRQLAEFLPNSSDEIYNKTGLKEVTPKCCRNLRNDNNIKSSRTNQNQKNSLDNNTTSDIDDNQPNSSQRSSYRDTANDPTSTSLNDKSSRSYDRIKELESPQNGKDKMNTNDEQSSKRLPFSDDTNASPSRSERKNDDSDDDKSHKKHHDSKNDKLACICSISTDPVFNFTERFQQSKFDRILIEEMDKSNKARRDIQNILGEELSRPCEVQLTFDIPTKDISTEVTASLSKAKLSYHNQTENSGSFYEESMPINAGRQMTIAVNTDPLSLLSLLRFSTETIGRLLSAVNFNYYSYLSMIQFPQLSRQVGSTSNQISQYVCNICGAAFRRASELNNHIQGHDLGNARDCCVCRHIVDLRRQPPGRFTCRYCGHCFTRAYCCELHQQSCARRLGKVHDIDESLTLLR